MVAVRLKPALALNNDPYGLHENPQVQPERLFVYVLQVQPHLVVTSQLIDVETGNIEKSQRLTGAPGETIFEVVDRMTGDTRIELELSTPKGVEHPKPVVDVTTN